MYVHSYMDNIIYHNMDESHLDCHKRILLHKPSRRVSESLELLLQGRLAIIVYVVYKTKPTLEHMSPFYMHMALSKGVGKAGLKNSASLLI